MKQVLRPAPQVNTPILRNVIHQYLSASSHNTSNILTMQIIRIYAKLSTNCTGVQVLYLISTPPFQGLLHHPLQGHSVQFHLHVPPKVTHNDRARDTHLGSKRQSRGPTRVQALSLVTTSPALASNGT